MKTGTKLIWLILSAMFLIAFNVAFYIITGDTNILPHGRVTSTWINYGCIHLAYAFLLLTPLLYPKNVAKDVAMPVWSLTILFWWFELILSTIFVFVEIPYLYNILLQVICFCAFGVRLCILVLVNRNTAEKVARHEAELQYVKIAEAQLKMMLSTIQDKNTYKQVEKTYDYIRTSPLRSCAEEAYLIERSVLAQISNLVVQDNNEQIILLANHILKLAQQRNQQLLIHN
jgi:hypothetical protein